MNFTLCKLVPNHVRSAANFIQNFVWPDAVDLLLGRRDPLSPPPWHRMRYGPGEYRAIGKEFVGYFVEICGLKPNERVMEVGCGIGLMALPLTKYLSQEGYYEGLDIIAPAIKWCQDTITPKYPNFRFQLADVYNSYYHPQGRLRPSDYTLPYPNESFDFVFLKSVFTHMLPNDIDNYLAEIARVLKRGGRCLITFFLLDNESLRLLDLKKSSLDFRYDFGNYRTISTDEPEAAVCYDEQFIRAVSEKHGLRIMEPLYYGSWCDRSSTLSYQDIVIASKNSAGI